MPVGRDHFISRLFVPGRVMAMAGCLAGLLLAQGCANSPVLLNEAQRATIDRRIIEYPDGYELKPYMIHLDTPTGFCFDESKNMIVAEGGIDGADPHIFVIRPDGYQFDIYPIETNIPVFRPRFRIYGPVGGIVARGGKIYVSHRDVHDMGAITAFDYNGDYKTIVAGLPAQGDFSVTDLAIPQPPGEQRLYFGVGSVTNSGVVGLDNWQEGWVRDHPKACDLAYQALFLLGFRFDALNPQSSLFSPNSLVTVPFEPFGTSDVIQIPAVDFPVQMPSGAIFSVALDGGDLKVEAWGVHDPVGIAIDPNYSTVYFTDRGMELRGTRPIDNDPDALYALNIRGSNWGWPDYARNGDSVAMPQYQPPKSMVIPTGYPNVQFVIDHELSKMTPPDKDSTRALFAWQSGAAKFDFFPQAGPFHTSRFEGQALVALWGDRAPFSTSGRPMHDPLPGRRIARVDLNSQSKQAVDFIYNVQGGPTSQSNVGRGQGLERPIDVKFGPDGNLYILDFGVAMMKDGHLKVDRRTGKILICVPAVHNSIIH